MDANYHALLQLLTELITKYHEKQANEHPASIGQPFGEDRGEDHVPAPTVA